MKNEKSILTEKEDIRYAVSYLTSCVESLRKKYIWDFEIRKNKFNENVRDIYCDVMDEFSNVYEDNYYYLKPIYNEDVIDLVGKCSDLEDAFDQMLVMPSGKVLTDEKNNVYTQDGNIIVKYDKRYNRQMIKVINNKKQL